MTVVEIKLDQEEANLILRGLEALEEANASSKNPLKHEVKSLQKLWGRVFDSGLDAGFGGQGDSTSAADRHVRRSNG